MSQPTDSGLFLSEMFSLPQLIIVSFIALLLFLSGVRERYEAANQTEEFAEAMKRFDRVLKWAMVILLIAFVTAYSLRHVIY